VVPVGVTGNLEGVLILSETTKKRTESKELTFGMYIANTVSPVRRGLLRQKLQLDLAAVGKSPVC
jgi:hypothetical protein